MVKGRLVAHLVIYSHYAVCLESSVDGTQASVEHYAGRENWTRVLGQRPPVPFEQEHKAKIQEGLPH